MTLKQRQRNANLHRISLICHCCPFQTVQPTLFQTNGKTSFSFCITACPKIWFSAQAPEHSASKMSTQRARASEIEIRSNRSSPCREYSHRLFIIVLRTVPHPYLTMPFENAFPTKSRCPTLLLRSCTIRSSHTACSCRRASTRAAAGRGCCSSRADSRLCTATGCHT